MLLNHSGNLPRTIRSLLASGVSAMDACAFFCAAQAHVPQALETSTLKTLAAPALGQLAGLTKLFGLGLCKISHALQGCRGLGWVNRWLLESRS